MTQSFVRLAILHEGERCAVGCPLHRGTPLCYLRKPLGEWRERGRRTDFCVSSATQQALDDAVLEAADRWSGAEGYCSSVEDTQRLEDAILARRSATREGGT